MLRKNDQAVLPNNDSYNNLSIVSDTMNCKLIFTPIRTYTAFRLLARIILAFLFFLIQNPEEIFAQEEIRLFSGGTGDALGRRVSISGDYAIISAFGDDTNGGLAGAAYIFLKEGDRWVEEVKLLANDGKEADQFGRDVSISGDFAIVGTFRSDNSAGKAYVFGRTGSQWNQIGSSIMAGTPSSGDVFGDNVAISGDYAIVSAVGDNETGNFSGAAYIFQNQGASWGEIQKLTASDADESDVFGGDVAIDGNFAIIGAPLAGPGKAYVFELQGSLWQEVDILTASDASLSDNFGRSVAISGDFAIVGAHLDDDNGDASGSAYVFQRNGSSWNQAAKLTPSDGVENGFFWEYCCYPW